MFGVSAILMRCQGCFDFSAVALVGALVGASDCEVASFEHFATVFPVPGTRIMATLSVNEPITVAGHGLVTSTPRGLFACFELTAVGRRLIMSISLLSVIVPTLEVGDMSVFFVLTANTGWFAVTEMMWCSSFGCDSRAGSGRRLGKDTSRPWS